jgi:hypothetical protein
LWCTIHRQLDYSFLHKNGNILPFRGPQDGIITNSMGEESEHRDNA